MLFSQVLNGHQRNDGKIEDFCDGQIFRSHSLFSKDPTALQLMLYYDEVEIANPLGSKTGKHKLGKFHDYLKSILFPILIVFLLWLKKAILITRK